MYAIIGLLQMAFVLWMYSSFKKVNDAPAKLKADILLIIKCFLIGTMLSAATGIISLFFYPLSQEINAIFIVLVCWLFPMGGALVGGWISCFKENK